MATEHQFFRCYWPEGFTKRRNFYQHVENQTYLDLLKTEWEDGVEDDGEDEDGGDEDPDEQEEEEGDDEYEDDDSIDGSSGDEDDINEDRNDSKEEAVSTRHSDVKMFMKGMDGDEDTLQFFDQVKQVTRFYKQAWRELDTGVTGKQSKAVALLDDMIRWGQNTADQGPLTSEELRQELHQPRFRIGSDQKVSVNTIEERKGDAGRRRLIFITDIDASSIEALTVTASFNQASALKDLLYKHLTRRASIGVTIPCHGFPVFTLDFHIPYFVLKASTKLLVDTRKTRGDKPLRKSWQLLFLSGPSTKLESAKNPEKVYSLYEAQISVAVTGIDDSVWTAYGFVDTYFGSKESVGRYHELKGRRGLGRADPFARGQLDATRPIWMPREYFLKILQIRIKDILREWQRIADKVEEAVKRSRTNDILPLSSQEKTGQEVRNFISWNSQMVILLRQLVKCLSATIRTWEKFQRREIGYFLYEESGAASSSLRPSLFAIDKAFSELNELRGLLQDLKKELCEDNPQGLHAYLSLKNNEAANVQLILSAIIIVFLPLTLATSLFSTQGVLPFTPNLAYFIYILVLLAVLIVVTLVVCSNWASWFQQLVNYLTVELTFPRITITNAESTHLKDVRDGTGPPKVAKRSLLARKLRKAAFPAPGDIEGRAEEGKTV